MSLVPEIESATLVLSRLRLNLRNRQVQRDLGNSQALHRRLLDAFPDQLTRAGAGLLYRVEPGRGADAAVLVQSTAQPEWSRLGPDYLIAAGGAVGHPAEVKEIAIEYAGIVVGQALRFRLRANPTRKQHFPSDASARPTGPNGTRVPLYSDADLQAWIARKGTQHGFRVEGVRWRPDPLTGERQRGRKADGMSLTHHAIVFEGVVRVTDAEAFRTALVAGIGPAKAYGFGLLSVAPAG